MPPELSEPSLSSTMAPTGRSRFGGELLQAVADVRGRRRRRRLQFVQSAMRVSWLSRR